MLTRLILCGVALPLVVVMGRAQPRLEIVGGEQFSLGKLFRGEVVERQLTLRNTGTDTLVISRVDASCGCTGTVLTSPRIVPRKEGMLKISFNSRNFSGPVHKTVTISSNAANARELVVNFTAEIIDEIVVTPPQFWVKDAEVGRPVELSLRIRNAGTVPLTLAKYRTALKGFRLTLPSSPIPPGKEMELRASFTPAAAVPFLAEGIFIETSNPRRQELYVPVYGNTKEFKFE